MVSSWIRERGKPTREKCIRGLVPHIETNYERNLSWDQGRFLEYQLRERCEQTMLSEALKDVCIGYLIQHVKVPRFILRRPFPIKVANSKRSLEMSILSRVRQGNPGSTQLQLQICAGSFALF